jgi:hypothetical protein
VGAFVRRVKTRRYFGGCRRRFYLINNPVFYILTMEIMADYWGGN